MNTQLLRSLRPSFAATTPGRFSTGNVSPVSTAWLTKKSLASSSTPSAGIRLPADSCTTSPCTTRSDGNVSGCPPRSTAEWMVILVRSRSMALPAMYSCVKPSRVLPNTITSTMPASIHSAAISEMTEATIRISTSGLLNWLAKSPSAVARFIALSALGPYCLRRRPASRAESPSTPEPSCFISASAGRLQYASVAISPSGRGRLVLGEQGQDGHHSCIAHRRKNMLEAPIHSHAQHRSIP